MSAMRSLLAVCFLCLIWHLQPAPVGSETTATPPCADKVSACASMAKTACKDPGTAAWAEENCPLTCGVCAKSRDNTPPCKDKLPSVCRSMNASACTNESTEDWMKENCALTCGVCGATTASPTSITPTISTAVITATPPAVTTHMCIDTADNCGDYGHENCEDPKYHKWAVTHCAKTCNKCGELENSTVSGCHYKGKHLTVNETMKDGCDLYCTCMDEGHGNITCESMCPHFEHIPDVCYFDPPVSGNCCRVLDCPNYIQINYPDGYVPR